MKEEYGLKDASILITGGAGYLGRAIIRRSIGKRWGGRITVFSRDSHKHALLLRDYPNVTCIQGDVSGDLDHLTNAIAGHDIVIHAGASKHVDLAERNVFDTVKANVDGTRNVALACARANVSKAVFISTDKACRSINSYGMTKAIGERIFQEISQRSSTQYGCVRYGNVTNSTGSVVNVWRDMLKRDGYVTATDPDMTRFWMSVKQAVDTVLEALRSPSGTVIIPRCKSLDMRTFAKYVLPEAEFKYSGLRPGEKRYEELLAPEESVFSEDAGDFIRLWPITGKPIRKEPRTYNSENAERLTKSELMEILA